MDCIICLETMEDTSVHDLAYCPKCGLYRKKSIPSDEVMKNRMKGFMLSACRNKETEKRRLANADKTIETIERFTLDKEKLYDIGAAGGFVMKAAEDRGWGVVSGNELSRSAIAWALKHYELDIDYGFFEEFIMAKDFYTAITLINTLEHTRDPYYVLRKCKGCLKKDGVVSIEVPIKTDEQVDKFYEGLHTTEFNRNNLRMLLELVGFEVVYDETHDKHPHYLHVNMIGRK